MKSKILLLSELYPYPPYKSGVCSTIYNFLLSSVANEYEIDLIHFEKKEQITHHLPKVDISVEFCNVSGKEFFCTVNNDIVLKPKGMFHIVTHKFEPMDVSQYAIVIFASITVSCICDRLLGLDKCKVILFEADSPVMFYERELKQGCNFIRKMYINSQIQIMKQYEKQIEKIVDKIVFVSDVDRLYVNQYLHKGKTSTAKLGVKFWNLKNTYSVGKKLKIGFSGKMNYSPNYLAVEYIIKEINPLLQKELDDYEIYIIGNNPDEKWIGIAKNDPHIIVTGYVDEICEYIADMDIYISPLFIGTGMKNKILEALSIGVPVIASDVSTEGIDGLIENENYVRCDEDASNWVRKIIELYKSTEKRERISINGKKLIENQYTWENFSYGLLN